MSDVDLGTIRYHVDANTAPIEQAGEAVYRFKQTAEQAAASTKRYGEQLIRTGASSAQAVKGVNQSTDALKRNKVAADQAATSHRNMRGITQQLGWQMQDTAIQLQMGTNAFTVLSQQGSQMAAAFGAQGALLGAVIAIGGAVAGTLVTALKGASQSTEELMEKIRELNDDMRSMSAEQIAFIGLTTSKAMKEAREEVESYTRQVEEMEVAIRRAQMQNDLQSSATRYVFYHAPTANIGAMQETLDELRASLSTAEQQYESLASGGVDKLTKSIANLIETRKLESYEEKAIYELGRLGIAITDERATTYLGLSRQLDATIAREKEEAAAIERARKESEAAISAQNKQRESLENIAKAYNVRAKSLNATTEREKLLIQLESEGVDITSDLAKAALAAASAYDEMFSQKQVDGAQKIINSLEDQYNKLVLTTKQQLALQLAAENATSEQIARAMELADAIEAAGKKAAEANPMATWVDGLDAVYAGVSKMQDAFADGSKEAKALGVVLQALAVAQGISAVLNQAQGDPYTAFARMAAMAAAVASLGVQIGGMSSGGADQTAASRQATQGTGTVFGDTAAQSESILKSSDITARATTELVGINRGMLQAMQNLQAGITGAVGGIIRGGIAIDVKTGTTNLLGDTLFTELEGLWGKDGLKDLFRNTRKLVDSGISILGGAFGDIMSGSVDFAVAFAEIEKKKKIFGLTVSESNREQIQALSDEVNRSLYQIITSMGDAVSSAAEVLGIAEEDIQDRLSAFEVQAQKISLKDLGAEEQEEQLNAVFSSIFDGLAASVVPFVKEFSQLGEGYAETLIRIATQTQVADELMTQLGNTIMDGLAGQALAKMADDLIKAAGGMDEFISSITGFVNAFATEEHKLKIAGDSINSAFEQMGLALPETRDGVWELMQTLTDPADIARLAQLSEALGIYYDALDAAAAKQAAIDAQRGDLTIQLLRALGDEEQALALERERALEGIHESNRALQLQVWAALDAANAEKKLTDARSSATDRALANLRQVVDMQIEAARTAYEKASAAIDADFDKRIESVRSSLQRRLEWFDNSISLVSDSIRNLSALSGQIASAIGANVVATEAMTLARRGAAQGVLQQALDRARAGQPVGDISGALSALSANVSGTFGSLYEEQYDLSVTANRLAELGQITDDQLSVEEKTLALLQEQKDDAKTNADRQIAALELQRENSQERLTAIYNSQVANYERMYSIAEEQVNALRGVEVFAGSIDEAITQLNDAMVNEFASETVILQEQNNLLIQSLIDEVKLLREQSVAYQRAIADYTKKSADADQTLLEFERAS